MPGTGITVQLLGYDAQIHNKTYEENNNNSELTLQLRYAHAFPQWGWG